MFFRIRGIAYFVDIEVDLSRKCVTVDGVHPRGVVDDGAAQVRMAESEKFVYGHVCSCSPRHCLNLLYLIGP